MVTRTRDTEAHVICARDGISWSMPRRDVFQQLRPYAPTTGFDPATFTLTG